MTKHSVCPLCGHKLVEGQDMLVATWFEPRQWWVAHHYSTKATKQDASITHKGVTYYSYCGRANYNPNENSFNT